MSAPSTSLSFSLDSLLFHPRHPSRSSSSSSCSRCTLSLNLSSPRFTLRHALPMRSIRRPEPQSLRPTDPSAPFPTYPPPRPCSLLGGPPRTGAFLGPDGLDKLHFLDGFRYAYEFPHGSLEVRLMSPEEVGATVKLLAESFADSMWIPSRYIRFLEFLVEQYVLQKRAQLPHAATLVVYYQARGGVEAQLAGTAEVSFNALGGNVSPPSPIPPRDAPYICNMTVKETLRRLIDKGPLNMYEKAGYSIVKTDNIFVWLRLQQRKHLMCKELALHLTNFDDQLI
uniref:Threonine--tRNA ligase n=1 Tax=Anthurium amnicola TaxID=1678845 RepID=A0A1D1XYC9_9ARAE